MAAAKRDLTIEGLVHDLNNVFQTIIDAADVVGSDPEWSSVSNIILRSVEQGRRIVASLAEKEHESLPFEQLVERSMSFAQDFSNSERGPRLVFIRDIAPGICANLKPAALERVLVNLFINASEAARKAGHDQCRIFVTARQRARDLQVTVADDGPGIPGDILPHLFSPGFSTHQHHSGLGLHIVHSIVTGGGGTVTASNGERNGAIFTFLLPAAGERAAAAGTSV